TTESVRVDQLNNVVADEGRLAERDELYYARDMTPNATATEQDRDDDVSLPPLESITDEEDQMANLHSPEQRRRRQHRGHPQQQQRRRSRRH
ncbi:MAG: hypothetical protein ACKPKO_56255, partial [Candidatus Fonsibacter sp.]